ncbi:MAG: hypothetical protein LBL13_05140 [Bacteroidales bacterium]|jgi:hypothetical protein|nr:hypothetical protein [Bacteroidales bacterium]
MNNKVEILVGYTGFVGSNLNTEHQFDGVFNSKNIKAAFGCNPDLCVYSGIRSEKFIAEADPKNDMVSIENAVENIKKINPKRLVLISTIDVFKNPNGMDETVTIDSNGLTAYGLNRYRLECLATNIVKDCHILRLPGLFGKNIKKNFIYDLINFLPSILNQTQFNEFSMKEPLISEHYHFFKPGFYKLECTTNARLALREAFMRIGFSALQFTDSRAVFQFYNLNHLWKHIKITIENEIRLLHVAVEPVAVKDIYRLINGYEFVNEFLEENKIPNYNFRTKYDELFNGKKGYIFNKEQVLHEIIDFVRRETQ